MRAERPLQLRTLFISDVHLGARGCQAELLVDFLRRHDAETIYLVGDIVDGWRLKRNWYWPPSHNEAVQAVLEKVRRGTRVIYIPGNHDEFLRDYIGSNFGGIEIRENAIHETADGQKLLVIHGDEFDVIVRHGRWLSLFGDWAYAAALMINTYVNIVRRRLGFSYWSLSAWAKMKVKNAVNFITNFEMALSREGRQRGVAGVICGHIHHPAMHSNFGIPYRNCGDWVESCTALAEDCDGRFELIRWAERSELAWQPPERRRLRMVRR
jgi:UDP-2,3-diacylglucosamine pyrophosphatase LpxH